MITGVQDIYYYVSDMARAVRFYCDVLKLSVVHQDKSWTSFDVGGVRVGSTGQVGDRFRRFPRVRVASRPEPP